MNTTACRLSGENATSGVCSEHGGDACLIVVATADRKSARKLIKELIDDGSIYYPEDIEKRLAIALSSLRYACIKQMEARRQKILNNPQDPSWTEHLAELQNEIGELDVQDWGL